MPSLLNRGLHPPWRQALFWDSRLELRAALLPKARHQDRRDHQQVPFQDRRPELHAALPQKDHRQDQNHQANQQPQSQLGPHLRDHRLDQKRQRALFQEKHRHQ